MGKFSRAEIEQAFRHYTTVVEGSRLERAFRDVYTGTQDAFISEKVAIDAAQI
jgi:hypothetical protein